MTTPKRMATARRTTAERRQELIDAALKELALTPLNTLSTRQLARRLGVSQPALFRHFRSREALLVATVEHARALLRTRLAPVLTTPGDGHVRLRTLAQTLARFVEEEPGLPRLLFSSPSPGETALQAALNSLADGQRALITTLIAEAQRDGSIDANCAAADAALLFLGMMQGTIHAWLAGDGSARRPQFQLEARVATLFALWWRAVAVDRGAPPNTLADKPSNAAQRAPPSAPSQRQAPCGITALDVRPILASGRDPLDTILTGLAPLPTGDVLVVTVPFRPTPLLALLSQRGHGVFVRPQAGGLFSVVIVAGGGVAPVDLSDLEPPEPLEVVLRGAATLAAGEFALFWLPRYPRILVPQLATRSVLWAISEMQDGSALLHLRGQPCD